MFLDVGVTACLEVRFAFAVGVGSKLDRLEVAPGGTTERRSLFRRQLDTQGLLARHLDSSKTRGAEYMTDKRATQSSWRGRYRTRDTAAS